MKEAKSVVAETFIRTLKNKIYKHVTTVSKNVYIIKLGEMVRKYNKTYHRTINMKPIDVKSDTCIFYDVYHNDKDPKLRVIIMLEYQNQSIFAKGYTLN